MAFWCPYNSITEQPLDLTTSTADELKMETLDRQSPESVVPGRVNLLDYQDSDSYHNYELHTGCCSPKSSTGSSEVGSVTSNLGVMDPDPYYAAFRAARMEARTGGVVLVSNPRMRRSVRGSDEGSQDPEYLQRRARNNAAAKRSRDLRKLQEHELDVQIDILQQEHRELRELLEALSEGRCIPCKCKF